MFQVTHLAQKLSATTTQETIKEQKPSQVRTCIALNQWQCPSVGPPSTNVRWVAMTFCTDSNGSQKMNPNIRQYLSFESVFKQKPQTFFQFSASPV